MAIEPVKGPLISAGDVDRDSAVLLAKAAVAGLVTFQVSTAADFSALVAVGSVTIADPLAPAKLRFADGTLAAGTQYYWRAIAADGGVSAGAFRTADAAGVLNGFSLGVTGDWRGELAPYPAISNADTAGLDLFVKLGDTIYSDYASPALNQPQAFTLADYLTKHFEVYGGRAGLNTWNDLQKTTAILATIDDHEVVNDFAGGATIPTGQDTLYGAGAPSGTPTGTLVNDTPLYDNGLTAFQAWNAIETRTWANTGSDSRMDGEVNLYRYSQQGRDAAVFVVDERSFRDAEIPDWNGTQQDAVRFIGQAFTPGRTMLGNRQFDQLKADLLDAKAQGIVWKFVTIPEPIQNYGPLAAADRYEGYAAERSALLKFIDDNDIENVVFISADVHGTTVNNLTYQLPTANGLSAQIALPAFDISTGSVAFDAPFGPTAVGAGALLGLVSQQNYAFYLSLPAADDSDSVVNDRGDFFKALLNQQLDAFGYDRVGLNDNLAQARGLLSATLVSGDYVAVDSFGWTRFDTDVAGKLTVTTYGIPPYTEATATSNAVVNATPAVVSQFTVAASHALEFSLFRNAAQTDALTDLAYTNTAVSGSQTASALTDTTGADLARFRAAGGDVAISAASFGSGQVTGAPLASLAWTGPDSASLVFNGAWGSIAAVSVSDYTGAALTLRNWAQVTVTGMAAVGQTIFADGARGGSFTMGSGNDIIRIGFDNDGAGGVGNGFTASTGAGADLVEFIAPTIADLPGTVAALGSATVTLGAGNDSFIGGAGNDTVDGGTGADRMAGGVGNDTYLVDTQADLVFEAAGGGNDSVIASTGFYLYANIETLILDSAAGGIFGVGNAEANTLVGNGAANLLLGGDGNDTFAAGEGQDTVFGQAGDDSIDGGVGADALVGGAGNDSYAVDTQADLVFESTGEGNDTVTASIDGGGFYLYAGIEALVLAGTTRFGVGNGLANTLTGNAADNLLLGGAGDDSITGGAGRDVMFGEAGADRFIFTRGSGADVIGDFTVGADKLVLTGLGFSSAAQVLAATSEFGGSSAIDLAFGDFVVLNGVTKAALTATDFIL